MRFFQLYLIASFALVACGPQPSSPPEAAFEAAASEASMEASSTISAQYDGVLGAPVCSTVGSSCSSGNLLRGRSVLGPESSYPNTLDSCYDGAAGQYRASPSVEWIRVEQVDGTNLAAGKRVRVVVGVYASNPAGEALDLYVSYNGPAVAWSPLATLRPVGSGDSVLSAEYMLGVSSMQAVRAIYRLQGPYSSPSPCVYDGFSDHDDLAFAVGQEPDTTPPSATLTSPAAGAVLRGTVSLTATASDDFAVYRMEFYDGTSRIGTDDSAPYSVSWETYFKPNGSHTLTARALDLAGNVGISIPVTVTVDNDHTDPVTAITSPAAGETLVGTVTISATASDAHGVTGVEFYVGTKLLGTVLAPPYELTWNTGAEPVGSYTLRTWAYDPSGNAGLSAPVTVTVARDSTPPSVELTAPAAGATVEKLVQLKATATDNLGVTRVDFFVDGALLGSDTYPPFEFYPWDTRTSGNGSHTLTARAYDAEGNVGVSPAVAVTVNNDVTAPTVSVTAPAAGTTLSGWVDLTASAADDRAVSYVAFYLDGVALGWGYPPTYRVTWNSRNGANGVRSLTAKAFDAAGNAGTSAPVSVTVDNDLTPPVVSITAPGQGAVLAGMVSLQAAASDDRGISRVEFFLNGASIKSISSPPYAFTWDSHSVPNGTYTLTAKAADTSYNYATSAGITVTVAQPGAATYDTALGVPACPQGSTICDSSSLLQGRGPKGPELNAPNTLDACADGTDNSYRPEQIRWIRVSRPDGLAFATGRRVLVEAAVEVNSYSHGTVDFYFASNAAAPVWTHLATRKANTSVSGLQVISVEYVLPAGGLQAVRANFWRGDMYPTPCSTGPMDDRDDLVFGVSEAVDETPPTVSITDPVSNKLVTGFVTITATAQDDFNVTKVEFYDGQTLIGSDTTAPFSVVWDTTSTAVADGGHTLSAKAYDGAGRVGTSGAVPVVVDKNKPSATVTAPAAQAIVRGTIQVSATASDDRGISKVAFYESTYGYPNGRLLGTDTTAPYSVSWDTTTIWNGGTVIRAVAFDLAGNVRESAVIGLTVDNAAPTVAITAPGNGAAVSLSTTLQAAASDNNGVTQVAFYDGTKLLGTDTTAPYSFSWSLLLVARGQHTLTARATDVAGNVTTSAPVVVTVQ